MIEFKRELIEAEGQWIVRSSYVSDQGVPHSLQVRWDQKPTEEQLLGDHQFLEQKLLLGAHIQMMKDSGAVITWKDVMGVGSKTKRNKSNSNTN